jgi:hypothetical protein
MSFFPENFQIVGGKFYQNDNAIFDHRKHIGSGGGGSTTIGVDGYNYANSYVERVNQTVRRGPEAPEIEEGGKVEEIDDAEAHPSTRIYQFHNCKTVFMNTFSARGVNVKDPGSIALWRSLGRNIEHINDTVDIRPTNRTSRLNSVNVCGVAVKDSLGSDDQALPPTALGHSPRLAAPSEPPSTPTEFRRNNPFHILAPPNNNSAHNLNASATETKDHPRHYPPEYPIPTDSSLDTNPKCLEHLLESALATALIIQTSGISSPAEILTTRAQNTLNALNALVSVESPASSASSTGSDPTTRSRVTKWLRIPQLQTAK